MGEYWQNVFHDTEEQWLGSQSNTREGSVALADWVLKDPYGDEDTKLLYRIHVRLKPEGAPRRYFGAWEKMQWEDFANGLGPRPRCKGDVA